MVAPDRRLISIQAAADMLAVTDRTIRNFIDRGDLCAYRVGDRTIRVDAAEVVALLKPIPAKG